MLELKKITYKYQFGNTALVNVSFCVEKNKPLSILGEEESGKTTLLKLIAGLLKHDNGDIYFNGKNWIGTSTKDRNVCFISTKGNFFNNKSVKYNLEYPLKVRKTEKSLINAKIEDIAKKFGIEDILDEKIKNLNTNQRVLINLMRIFLREADVYLLDNPFSTLENRKVFFEKFMPLILDYCKNSVLIYATNSVEESLYFSNSTCVLNYGILIDYNNVNYIKNCPSSVFTCMKFNPNCKLTEGVIQKVGEKILLQFDSKEIEINGEFLLNEIYVGCIVKVCYLDDDNSFIKIFDYNCERNIYFE